MQEQADETMVTIGRKFMNRKTAPGSLFTRLDCTQVELVTKSLAQSPFHSIADSLQFNSQPLQVFSLDFY